MLLLRSTKAAWQRARHVGYDDGLFVVRCIVESATTETRCGEFGRVEKLFVVDGLVSEAAGPAAPVGVSMIRMHSGLDTKALSMIRQGASLLALANGFARWASSSMGLPLTGFSERRCVGALLFELKVQ